MKANDVNARTPQLAAKTRAVGLGIGFLLLLLVGGLLWSVRAKHHRQAEVALKGAQVMPFDLEKTTHLFEVLADGGLQTVTAKKSTDTAQIELIQSHLQEESIRFGAGDFSDPASIHGDDMPGLAVLQSSYRGLNVEYTALPAGASIRYTTQDPRLLNALNEWFRAQRSDHGHHAK